MPTDDKHCLCDLFSSSVISLYEPHNHFQPLPRSRRRRYMHPIPHKSAWHKFQLVKHRENLSSFLTFVIILITVTIAICEPWPSSGFLNNLIFTLWGEPHAQPPTWRTWVSLFVWLLLFDLYGLGGPTSSYATAGIALRVSGALKLHHHDKVRTVSVGGF
jgi:hypothetical protein